MIVVTGGTGFIGKALVRALRDAKKDVAVLTRAPKHEGERAWTPNHEGAWTDVVDGADAVIHLAGAGVADEPWTQARKKEIEESRTISTRILAESIARAKRKPRCFVSASAIGYYGFREPGERDESSPPGDDFLARVCVEWERAAEPARAHTRVVHPRIGIVLGEEGALPKMVAPFKAMVGGPIGSGRQVLSWIHVVDVVLALSFFLDKDDARGPVNLVAPQPVSQRVFASAIGKQLGRPALVPTPGFALKLALGAERANIVLEGQRVVPARLTELGYRFRFPTLEKALADLL